MIKSLAVGFKFSKEKMVITLLGYLAITFIAFFSIFPFTGQFHSILDNSIEAEKLLNNRWMPILLEEMVHHNGGGFGSLLKFGITLRIIFIFLSIFLSGGILECLYNKKEGSTIKNVLAGGSHYFHSLLWITFLSIMFFIPLLIIGGLISAGLWQLMKGSQSEFASIFLMFCIGLIAVFFLLLFKMAGDYGRIQRVIAESDTYGIKEFLFKNTLHFITGIKFLFRNLPSIYGITMPFFVLRIILIYCYLMYAPVVSSGLSLFTSFIELEVIIFIMVLLRVSEMNAELSLTTIKQQ